MANDRDHPSAIGPIVVDNRDAHRYEVLLDGEVVGFADYVERGDRVELPHTVIDRSMRGRGLAAILVERVLDDVRDSGRTVVPTCWYVAQFIDGHPDYADLVAN
jgi:predicted GNAT family acetyltransferase